MAYELEKKIGMEAAIAAAKLCERVREGIPPTLEKDDKSPVTVADYGSQAIVCRAVTQAFPNDPIVGEEDASDLRQPEMADFLSKITSYVQEAILDATPENILDWIDGGNGEVSPRYWTLDPIDGTKGFLRKDQYAIALALVEDGDVKVGIMACPALELDPGQKGILFVAVRGEGATMQPLSGGDPTPIRVMGGEDTANFNFVQSVESSHGDAERQQAIAETLGFTAAAVQVDSQAKYGIVAAGRAALYLRLPSPKYPDYREKIWDHAAGAIVVEEAGGRVTDMYGKPLDFASGAKMMNNRGVVVSNGVIHDRTIAALQ